MNFIEAKAAFQTLHKICAIQKRRCPPLLCLKPLRPTGACCRLRGRLSVFDLIQIFGLRYQLEFYVQAESKIWLTRAIYLITPVRTVVSISFEIKI